jgi:ABC-type polysaccharide/polyol phosphate export permease
MSSLMALGLLARGCFSREILSAPGQVLLKQFLVPAGILGFCMLLQTGGPTSSGPWPILAIGGVIWLLFVNCVNHWGMTLWHERSLLLEGRVPRLMLLAAAMPVPLALFISHVCLILVILLIWPALEVGHSATPLIGAALAAFTGVATGILAARLCLLRPGFSAVLPKLLLVSLVITPVFYRASALTKTTTGQAFCSVNPLCAAVELARAGFPSEAEPITPYAWTTTLAVAATLVVAALGALRGPVSPLPSDDE